MCLETSELMSSHFFHRKQNFLQVIVLVLFTTLYWLKPSLRIDQKKKSSRILREHVRQFKGKFFSKMLVQKPVCSVSNTFETFVACLIGKCCIKRILIPSRKFIWKPLVNVDRKFRELQTRFRSTTSTLLYVYLRRRINCYTATQISFNPLSQKFSRFCK